NPYFYNAIHTNNNNERDYAFHVREDLEVTAKIKKIETDGVLLELHATFQSGITTIIDEGRKQHQAELAKQKQADGLARYIQQEDKLELIESYRQSIDIPKEVDELKNREELFDDSTMWHIGSLKFKIMDDEMSELHDKINALKK
ncbi:7842_t:CDS:2, partial [Entrophospora sp. SA101]